ncbi:MAG: hypothetical protein IH892_22560, partial [Planctomycetes bacterium]|nr:hypothetical protein [Planctomycetota bacterium]
MCSKTTIAVGLMLVLAQVGLAAVDPSLVGWWRLDEGGGTVAIDSSGTGNNGELMGGPQYVAGILRGALEFNGTDQFVEVPHAPILTVDTEVTVMCWFNTGRAGGGTGDNWQGLIAKSNGPRSYSLYTRINNVFHFSVGASFVGSSSTGTFTLNEWTHVAAQVVDGHHQYYINGEDAGTGGAGTILPGAADTGPVYIGRTAEGLAARAFLGMIDDARIYTRALSQEEVADAMKGNLFPIAENPLPADESPDVVRDVDLSWTAGEFAQTHNVYFGAVWDDVNAASTDNPLGVLVSQGQSTDTFDPGRLGFSQTYYWRVDEVNAAPDSTVFKGDVWGFTVEPFSIPIDSVTATASSSFGASGPEKTVDGSGMAGDLHGASAGDMWISGGIPATIEYAFDRAYKLHELWIWNSNQLIEAFVGFGAKDVVIEHSLDGENWTVLDGVGPLAGATGSEGYAHNNTIDFGGAVAQHVRATVNSVQ